MADNYTKLFSSIIASSIWCQDDKTRILWITMLSMSDENGLVKAAIPGLADLSRMSIPDCEKSILKLLGPDKYSKDPAHDGRRIKQVPGGYLIINRVKYQKLGNDRTEYWREYKAKKRAEKKELSTLSTVDIVDKSGHSTNSTQEEEKEEEKEEVFKKESVRSIDQKTPEPKKKKYMDCLYFADGEIEKLCEKIGTNTAKDYLERLNYYVGSTGTKYKSHYMTILNWWKKDQDKIEPKTEQAKTRLFPIPGKNCSKQGCKLPAVYKATGPAYDSFYCGEHMPKEVKEKYTW